MLLERAGELKRFERLLAAAEAGRGETVLVRGPAGIGKTALVNALAAAAAGKGFSVLRARGRPLEREVPFGVAHQLLDPVLRRATQAERDRLLAGAALVGARALGLWGGDSPPDRFAGIHGMYWLSANLAEREVLVMVVDDLQWADDTSLEWLGYLAARCTELRLLLAVTVLEGHAGEPQAVGALGGEALPVSLLPLSANGVETLIRAALDEQAETAFCVACHELTGGNPLFVRELLAAIRDEGFSARLENVPLLHSVAPSAVGTSVRVRLSQLGDDAIALAHAAAVLGDGTEVAAAAELAGIEPVTAELIADRLAAAQLLAPKRPLEFFHPLISAALYEEMPPGERRVAHRRAAEILDRDRRLAQAVSHLLETGPARDSWVVERLVAAAAAAVDRAAPEIAASYLRRAVAEPPPPDQEARVLLMLGTAEHRAGEPGAIPHLEQALALARDSETRLAAATTLAPAYVARDQTTLALTALERMLEELDDRDGQLALDLLGRIVAVSNINMVAAGAATKNTEQLLTRLERITDPPVQLLVPLINYAAQTNRPAAQIDALVERARASQPYPPPPELWSTWLAALAQLERYDLLEGLCQDLGALARRRGSLEESAVVAAMRAWGLHDTGALADAESEAMWAAGRSRGVVRWIGLKTLLPVLIERDELDEAEAVLSRFGEPPASTAVPVLAFHAARGRMRAAQGRLREGLADLMACGQPARRVGAVGGDRNWRSHAALILHALGDAEQARRLSTEDVALARMFGRPRTLGIALRADGMVSDGEQRVARLANAVAVLERAHAPVELARARADYGVALRRSGQRIEARAQIEQALDLAHHCGARRIARSARAELVALGAKPRRDAVTGRDALTASELRVARLAAQGMSNREIAQALFITHKTASVHLSRIYRKLGFGRRDQLVTELARQSPTGTAGPAQYDHD